MIVILTQCFPSRLGGIESLMGNLSLELSKKNKVIVLADRHHFFYDRMYDNKYKNEILVRRIQGLKFFRRRRKIKELKQLIQSNQIKLIISDTWKSLELATTHLNEKKIPTICLAHGNDILTNEPKKLERIKRTLNNCTSIIANSRFTLNLIKKLSLNNNNLGYIYPGAEDLREINVDKFIDLDGKPLLLTLARLEKRKGHFQIIKLIKELIKYFPNLKYIIAGDGPEKTKLKKLVDDYKLSSNIFFVGSVNLSQKKFLFENADLMIMPTIDESVNRSIEGFGITYLEAAFFSVPSIASNIGGTPEAVLHEKTGIIIDDFDALYDHTIELLNNKSKLEFLGKNAQIRAINEFKWENVINHYYKLFKSMQ